MLATAVLRHKECVNPGGGRVELILRWKEALTLESQAEARVYSSLQIKI